jgi:hypothetical protein
MTYHSLRLPWIVSAGLLMIGLIGAPSAAAPPQTAPSVKPRIATRVFFQDDDARTLKWAELIVGDTIQISSVGIVSGFPKLDGDRQSLVQMEAAAGMLLIGVRDDDDGTFQSGWVLIDTGVDEEEHGDHSHWNYRRPPRVRASVLDDKQGNPAHLYCYDGVFYLANDKLNGYTRLDPAGITQTDDATAISKRAAFHQGGGGHITLAAAENRVAYSSWIDREGPNKGRIDVTALKPGGNAQIGYTFALPHGGIHGAIVCQGKAFFAPAEGICWVTADVSLKADPQQLQIHHHDLGKDGDKPRRTGAFTSFGKHVAFVTGAGPTAALCLADASRDAVEVHRLPLTMAEGNRPAGLEFVQPRTGSPLAFVFHDHAAEVEAPNRLSLVEVDPNTDGNWSDAKIALELDVGKSRVEGHAGHHSVAFDADRRRALFTNPGDGTVTIFSLDERKIVTEFRVSGVPTKLLAVGGRGSAH